MDVRPDIQIQSMIKAMIDVVLPAVDAENKVAQEQARLVIGTLQLVAKRLPIAYRYDCDELRRYVLLAQDLVAEAGPGVSRPVVAQLAILAAHGSEVLKGAQTEPSALEAAIFSLRSAVGELVQVANKTGSAEARKTVRKLVLNAAKTELEREIAVVIDMGFQTDPDDQPEPIEQQLARLN